MDQEKPITEEEISRARQVKEATKARYPGARFIPDETVALILRSHTRMLTSEEGSVEGG